MFFSKKEDPPPPRRENFGTGQATRQRVFRMEADRLEALGYQCSKNPEEFFLFFPVERAAGRYDIIWRVTDKHVTVVTLSPFTVSGCPGRTWSCCAAWPTPGCSTAPFTPTRRGTGSW